MLGTKKLNDEQLIDAIKKGDRNALLQLYRDNYITVRNYIINNNGKHEDAEDILQDATIVIWEKIQKGNLILTAKLSTFVFAICKNLWLKKLNKLSKQVDIDVVNTENLSEKQEHFSKENLNIVVEMLGQLGDKCKDLLTYFYFDGLDMTKIANLLNYNNADTVKAKKHQCFKHLQELFVNQYNKTDFL